jgi:NitT/TauT family transport system substrate-binding protein
VVEGGGTVLLDERTLWPGGDFVTAHVIVSAPFLRERPEVVESWLEAHVEVTLWENENPEEAARLRNSEIERLTEKAAGEVLNMALASMRSTWDRSPLPFSSPPGGLAYGDSWIRSPISACIYDLNLVEPGAEEKGWSRGDSC